MTFISKLVLACLTLSCLKVSAQLGEQILFPPSNESLRVLPSELEYIMKNSTELELGGALFSAADIDLQLISSTGTLKFKWPPIPNQNLTPLLTLRDNTGRIIWSRALEPKVNQYSLEAKPENLLSLIQTFPFFRFCVNYQADSSQAFLCSRDFYLSERQKTYSLQTRTLKEISNPVEINGRPGGPRGKFFLSSGREPLHLKANFQTGSFLEFFLSPPLLVIRDIRTQSKNGAIQLRIESTLPTSGLTAISLNPESQSTEIMHALGPKIIQSFEILKPPVDDSLVLPLNPSRRVVFSDKTEFSVEPNKAIELKSRHPRVQIEERSPQDFKVSIRNLEVGPPRLIPFEIQYQGQSYGAQLIIQRERLIQHRTSLLTPGRLEYRGLTNSKLNWQALIEAELSLVESNSSLNSTGIMLGTARSDWRSKLSGWELYPVFSYLSQAEDEDRQTSLLAGLSVQNSQLTQNWFAQNFELALLPIALNGNQTFGVRARLLTGELATEGLRLHVHVGFAESEDLNRKKQSKTETGLGISLSF